MQEAGSREAETERHNLNSCLWPLDLFWADFPQCNNFAARLHQSHRAWSVPMSEAAIPVPAGDSITKGEGEGESKPTEDGPSVSEEPKRKRKSRWGDPDDQQPTSRKSRWGSKPAAAAAAPAAASVVPYTPSPMDLLTAGLTGLTQDQKELLQIRIRMAELNQIMMNPEALHSIELSPSPEPLYNSEGKRINTRQHRIQQKFAKERTGLLERMMALSPELQAANAKARKTTKITIPQESNPNYNFIGLIIGPRGNTQKRMEKETGAKISIRGKGAHKSGKASKQINQPGDDEPLHVYISADDQTSLDAAVEAVNKLLVPVDETNNDHKTKQLRELAAINGTIYLEQICRSCGEKGHVMMKCPNRSQPSWKPADVYCNICGSSTHPEVDCPNRKPPVNTNGGPPGLPRTDINSEYASFMAELTGGPATTEPTAAPHPPSSAPTATPHPPPTPPPPKVNPPLPAFGHLGGNWEGAPGDVGAPPGDVGGPPGDVNPSRTGAPWQQQQQSSYVSTQFNPMGNPVNPMANPMSPMGQMQMGGYGYPMANPMANAYGQQQYGFPGTMPGFPGAMHGMPGMPGFPNNYAQNSQMNGVMPPWQQQAPNPPSTPHPPPGPPP